jgi:hypothetical protein
VAGSDDGGEMLGSLGGFGIVLLAKHDVPTARTMLSLLPEDAREETEKMLTLCEALTDPEKVLTARPLDEIDNAEDIAAAWARRDPSAAARWIESLPEPVHDKIVGKVAGGWALKDRDAAIAWACRLAVADVREAACEGIAGVITEALTLAQADASLTELPAAIADRARMRLAASESGDDRALALTTVAEVLSRHTDDEDFQKEGSAAVSDLVRWLAGAQDEFAAAAWLATLPDAAARQFGTETLAAAWASKDSTSASEWVDSLPPGDVRARAVVGLLEKIGSDDPERALAWARSLPAGDTQTEQVAKVLRQWLPTNPYAAIRAVESLPEELRDGIWRPTEEPEADP